MSEKVIALVLISSHLRIVSPPMIIEILSEISGVKFDECTKKIRSHNL